MRSTLSEDNAGIRWTLFSNLEDLDNADDRALKSHLGSVVTSEGGADKDIVARIGKARGSFVKLAWVMLTKYLYIYVKSEPLMGILF